MRVAAASSGIAVIEQREDAAPQRQPGMLGRRGTALEEPMRPLQPAVRNRLLAPERRRIPGDPDRHPRRAQAVVALAIDAIRAFADVEHDVGQIEPPGGEPEAFERLGMSPRLQRRSNARRAACQSPRPSAARPASRPLGGLIGVTRSRRESWVFTAVSPAQITTPVRPLRRPDCIKRCRLAREERWSSSARERRRRARVGRQGWSCPRLSPSAPWSCPGSASIAATSTRSRRSTSP